MKGHGIKGRIAGSVLLLWSYLTLYCASLFLVLLLPIFVFSPVAFRYIYDRLVVGPLQCAIGVSFYYFELFGPLIYSKCPVQLTAYQISPMAIFKKYSGCYIKQDLDALQYNGCQSLNYFLYNISVYSILCSSQICISLEL